MPKTKLSDNVPALVTKCPHCGVSTRNPRHCLDKRGPKLQTHCPDCGELSRDPEHCSSRPDCANPYCLNKAFYVYSSTGYRVCRDCIGIDIDKTAEMMR